ncbi:MAG: hypothetical protein GF388_09475 [Candidatus Aegiribacteria sp.]|nr:hypothetical protein [Candidatus Aegiribacteria sp.]
MRRICLVLRDACSSSVMLLATVVLSVSSVRARTCTVTPQSDFRDSLAFLACEDTLILSPGYYSIDDNLPLIHVMPEQAGITITGSQDSPAVLDGIMNQRPVILLEGEGFEPTRVENLIVTGGNASGEWYAGGGAFLSETFAVLQDCCFCDNAAIVGGGLAMESGTAEIKRCTFLSDSAVATGGAINVYAGNLVLEDSRLIGNTSSDDGGSLNSYQGDLIIRNVLMHGNFSGDDGGGMMVFQGSHTFEYMTIDSNTCLDDGAGFLLSLVDTVTVRSCIVTSNIGSYGMQAKGSAAAYLEYCCAWNNELGNYGGHLIDQTGLNGNISSNPLFADSLYRLSQTDAGQSVQSPCVDAGHEIAFTSCIEGYSTRTDSLADHLQADIGYHQPFDRDSVNTGNEEIPVGMEIYPNPCQESLFIRVPSSGAEVSVSVFDICGRLLWKGGGTPMEGIWSGMWTPDEAVTPGLLLIVARTETAVLTGKAVMVK